MGKAKDLTGMKFGKLLVQEYVGKRTYPCGTPYKAWKCKCDCGKSKIVADRQLISGNTKSCGCLNKMHEDFTGKRFGRLMVIRRAENKNGHIEWECKCDCGKTTYVTSGCLKSGNTRSCGCLHSEASRKQRGIPHHKLTETLNAIKARCNNPKFKYYSNYGGRGIRVCDEWMNGREGHDSFITWSLENGYKEGMSLDRIDNDKGYSPDNCRWTTRGVQSSNRRARTSTGVLGVYKDGEKYYAVIGINYKQIRLGRFATLEEAAKARQEAELKYYGFTMKGSEYNGETADRRSVL